MTTGFWTYLGDCCQVDPDFRDCLCYTSAHCPSCFGLASWREMECGRWLDWMGRHAEPEQSPGSSRADPQLESSQKWILCHGGRSTRGRIPPTRRCRPSHIHVGQPWSRKSGWKCHQRWFHKPFRRRCERKTGHLVLKRAAQPEYYGRCRNKQRPKRLNASRLARVRKGSRPTAPGCTRCKGSEERNKAIPSTVPAWIQIRYCYARMDPIVRKETLMWPNLRMRG